MASERVLIAARALAFAEGTPEYIIGVKTKTMKEVIVMGIKRIPHEFFFLVAVSILNQPF
jgi:hypothetical protein